MVGLRHWSALTTCLSHRCQVSGGFRVRVEREITKAAIKENGEMFSIKDWNLSFVSVERSKITLRWVELLWRTIFWTLIDHRSSWDIVEGLKCCNLKAVFQLENTVFLQNICLYFRFDTWKIAVFLCSQCKFSPKCKLHANIWRSRNCLTQFH